MTATGFYVFFRNAILINSNKLQNLQSERENSEFQFLIYDFIVDETFQFFLNGMGIN